MKQAFAAIFVALVVSAATEIPSPKKTKAMKLNAGVITKKIAESKEFYTKNLGFGISFENDFYLLLHTPGKESEISFLLPGHESQQPVFHPAYEGKGMYITIEVEDVKKVYEDIKKKGVEIKVDLREEPWGDTHFVIVDPNGIGVDIVTYSPR